MCVCFIRPTIQIRRRSERVTAPLLCGVRRPREGSHREEEARGTVGGEGITVVLITLGGEYGSDYRFLRRTTSVRSSAACKPWRRGQAFFNLYKKDIKFWKWTNNESLHL